MIAPAPVLERVRLSEVKPEPIDWLWPGRIAKGKITFIAGHPGLGKSQITASIAATVSTGGLWPVDEVSADTGDVLILSAEDGIADTIKPRLLAACDRYRYEQLGCDTYHRNCTDNLWEAMISSGYKITETPSPFNLWQNTPVEPDGRIKPNPPTYQKGDYIVMRAEMNLVICLSACPQDITAINGNKPRNAHYEITH